ncbi:hypothetical protein [Calidithermus roseus]|uniref:Uncharacterized protein n=1 Tax=Calidithermus roseus TaxID=1644118 RepID=A0A399EFG5_9DEIN|nr:hypothetical protein [Calidithermus roseus]RIH81889.1 hypothetical protein Mrose_03512 [Calidithermus roseus]
MSKIYALDLKSETVGNATHLALLTDEEADDLNRVSGDLYETGELEVVGRWGNENCFLMRHYLGHGCVLDLHDPEAAWANVDANALDELLGSEQVAALVQRIRGGYSSKWDGQNVVGQLDEDAQAALAELQQLIYACDRLPDGYGYWPVDEALRHYQLQASDLNLVNSQGVEALVEHLRQDCLGYGIWLDRAELWGWVRNRLEQELERGGE